MLGNGPRTRPASRNQSQDLIFCLCAFALVGGQDKALTKSLHMLYLGFRSLDALFTDLAIGFHRVSPVMFPSLALGCHASEVPRLDELPLSALLSSPADTGLVNMPD